MFDALKPLIEFAGEVGPWNAVLAYVVWTLARHLLRPMCWIATAWLARKLAVPEKLVSLIANADQRSMGRRTQRVGKSIAVDKSALSEWLPPRPMFGWLKRLY